MATRPDRQTWAGILVALGVTAILALVMVPLRSHLSIATAGLVFVIPVVAAVAVGGFVSGLVGVVAGFLVYDIVFIPPYYTLGVGAAENWVALIVYFVVMVVVAQVFARQRDARAEARQREHETRRLFELSNALISEQQVQGLASRIVTTVQDAFGPRWCALILPDGDRLEVVASTGAPREEELAAVTTFGGQPHSLGQARLSADSISMVLVADARPVGILAMGGATITPYDRDLLHVYVNQAAIAIDRTQLRSAALRSELLEEVDRWRGAMLGAVSHDLRTPLAAMKAAVSDLRELDVKLTESERAELLELVETQTDRLARLVSNLLDMTVIEAGALNVNLAPVSVDEMIDAALFALSGAIDPARIRRHLPEGLALVEADDLLITQVLANLLENAQRHSPPDQPIVVSAQSNGSTVTIAVDDAGPGVEESERERVFLMFNRVAGGGRAGLGLAIAKTFVEAHGQTIELTDSDMGGARFSFSLAVSLRSSEVV